MKEAKKLQVEEYSVSQEKMEYKGLILEITRFSKISDNDFAWMIPQHTHPDMELHYITKGKGRIQIGDAEFMVSKGDIFMTLPFVMHKQISDDKDIMEEYCIECQLEFSEKALKQKELSELYEFVSKQVFFAGHPDQALESLFYILEQELTELKNGYLTRTELLFFNCVLSFLYTLNNVENKYPIKIPHQKELMAQKVKNFLELNFYRNFTTKEVSQALYLSERQLNRIFQSEYHMTMHDYLQKLRVNHAKLLMQESRYNMKEVAFLCGFSGYQQLHRALIADTSS